MALPRAWARASRATAPRGSGSFSAPAPPASWRPSSRSRRATRTAARCRRSSRYAGAHNTFSVAAFVLRALELEGPAAVISCACSSSGKVFASAQRAIAAGLIDAAVVGGVDSLCLTTLHGFNSLQLVSRTPVRPFDVARDGLSIGEAAAFALLERCRCGHRCGVRAAVRHRGERAMRTTCRRRTRRAAARAKPCSARS